MLENHLSVTKTKICAVVDFLLRAGGGGGGGGGNLGSFLILEILSQLLN